MLITLIPWPLFPSPWEPPAHKLEKHPGLPNTYHLTLSSTPSWSQSCCPSVAASPPSLWVPCVPFSSHEKFTQKWLEDSKKWLPPSILPSKGVLQQNCWGPGLSYSLIIELFEFIYKNLFVPRGHKSTERTLPSTTKLHSVQLTSCSNWKTPSS